MRDIRISLVVIISLLVCLGITMIYSASGVYAMMELGDQGYFFKRHMLFLCIGLIFMITAMAIDYRQLKHLAKPLLISGVIMLVLVLIPVIGKASYGARRWFNLGPFFFQPSEFMKLAMMVYVADFLARRHHRLGSFVHGFMPVMLVLGVTCLLILKQPDLGSALLIGAIALVMLFIAGARFRHIGLLGLLALPAFYALVVRVPYRWIRIITFLDPWQDRQGAGFQLTQSQIALGNGGLFGVGLGQSMQKLFYLPAGHTEFLLSIIGEELGFIGVFLVVLLFIAFIWQGARIAKRVSDPFGYFLCVGIVAMIGLQAAVNVGVSIGALPTKGLPLPFISYGGSALVFNMICVGLLLNISRMQDLME
jgi:cell division protein FtsW